MNRGDMKYPRMRGKMIRWARAEHGRLSIVTVRKNRGIKVGDTGLVIEQNVSELKVLINGRLEYFQMSEIALIS